MKPARWWFTLAALAGAAALAACGLLRREQQVRLAIVDWPAYEYFYLASRKGLDQQLGYRLQVDQFGSLQDQRRAFSRGDVEAIATTLPEAIAICREAPLRCPRLVLVLENPMAPISWWRLPGGAAPESSRVSGWAWSAVCSVNSCCCGPCNPMGSASAISPSATTGPRP